MHTFQFNEYPDASSFLKDTRPTLEAEEVLNNLLIGIAERVEDNPQAFGEERPYMATLKQQDSLAAVCLMTPPHRLITYFPETGDDRRFSVLVQHLIATPRSFPGLIGPKATTLKLAQAWTKETGIKFNLEMDQGVYALKRVVHPASPGGQMVQAAVDHTDLLLDWAKRFFEDLLPGELNQHNLDLVQENIAQGSFFVWMTDQPVSMAARSRPTRRGECVNFVYTPPQFRRRGYASALVASLSQHLLEQGKSYCTLFTDFANPTSNHIYQEVGYQPVGNFIMLGFDS